MSGASLELRAVSKTFGGLRAVQNVAFAVPAGSIFGVIGPNGAGKTTVFNLVTGVYRPDPGGSIRLGDRELTGLPPAKVAAAGVARTFQNIRLFARLTVLENVLVACELGRATGLGAAILRTAGFFADEVRLRERAMRLLTVFGLDGAADQPSTSLSYGNQRRLEIARAMMLDPKVILLDEPAAGMNYGEAEGLKDQIRWLRDEFALTVVLVEHNMQVVMGVCERIHVLDRGETLAEGTPDEVRRHPKVLAAYLGGDDEPEASSVEPRPPASVAADEAGESA